MGRKPKISYKKKIKICRQYLEGKYSAKELAEIHGIYERTIYRWANTYRNAGPKAFLEREHNRTYTKEFKQQVIEAYLRGEGSMEYLADVYEIPSGVTLRSWIAKYNSCEELKDYNPRPEVYMAEKRRKTTQEERLEIVNYCLAHNTDYKHTALTYDVSYTQVYQWVRKFKESGEDGLADNRGKRKPEEKLSEIEKLQRTIKLQNRIIEEKDMEIALLKKVQEVERRRSSPQPKTKRNI